MISEERMVEIAREAEEVAIELAPKATKTSIKNLSQILVMAHPAKGEANLVQLQMFLKYQAGRRKKGYETLLGRMDSYFKGSYEEAEYFLGYLSWAFTYHERLYRERQR